MPARRRRARLVLVVLLVLPAGGGVCLWWMSWLAPQWWDPPDASDPRVVRRADDLEHRLIAEAQRIRSDGRPWRVRVHEDDLNAWLSARLPSWISHFEELTWPDGLGRPQLHIDETGIEVAIELREGDRMRFVAARLRPAVRDGLLFVNIERVALGRLALPGAPVETVVNRVRAAAPESFLAEAEVQGAMNLLFGQDSIAADHELVDGRRVRLLDLRLRDGAVDLTCRTSIRPQRSSRGE